MSSKSKARIEKASENGAIVVKKYANRRLYNTATSSYVTLDDLSVMVKDGVDFVVFDAKTGEDITRSVLTQIIFEQEGRDGQSLLPVEFLRKLIRFYGDSMQAFVPSYLEASMEAFTRQQEALRERFSETWGPTNAMKMFEDHARQNMALFQQTVRMFTPFSAVGEEGDAPAGEHEAASGSRDPSGATIDEMRRQMTAMQNELARLSGLSQPSKDED